jgi:ADP-ribose pyrophosphatase
MVERSETRGRARSSRRAYEGRVLSLDVDTVEEPGGVVAIREVVRHQGSVAALPVHEDGTLVLVRQYRYAVDQSLWEIPAGRLEAKENPSEGVKRELEEEVGLRAGALEALLVAYTSPGFCDETLHLFRANRLEAVPPRPEADERIEIRVMTLDEARGLVRRGEIRDAKTLLALLLEGERRTEVR